MQRTFWSALAGACVIVGLMEWSADAEPLSVTHAVPTGTTGLITYVQENEGRPTRVIVIDQRLQAMCVYDVPQDSGEIQPKSFRHLKWDFQMENFNTGEPLPEAIRKGIQRN